MAVRECHTFRQWLTCNVLCAFRNMLKIMLALGCNYSPFFWKITAASCSCIAISVLLSCLTVFLISTECLEFWCNLSIKPVLSHEQALNQLLWNNQFLIIDGKPILNKMFFSKDLTSLANNDILTNTGRLKILVLFQGRGA